MVEECAESSAVTVLIRGGNRMIVDEAKLPHDAMCVVRNLIKDNRVVYEAALRRWRAPWRCRLCRHHLGNRAVCRARLYPDALDDIPMALAENAGLQPIVEVSNIKSRQIEEETPAWAWTATRSVTTTCATTCTSLIGKQQQCLAAQV